MTSGPQASRIPLRSPLRREGNARQGAAAFTPRKPPRSHTPMASCTGQRARADLFTSMVYESAPHPSARRHRAF